MWRSISFGTQRTQTINPEHHFIQSVPDMHAAVVMAVDKESVMAVELMTSLAQGRVAEVRV